MADTVAKTLYRVAYFLDLKREVEYLTFFYAANDEEAWQEVERKKQKIAGGMQILKIKPCPQGMTIRQSIMPGKISVCDGTL